MKLVTYGILQDELVRRIHQVITAPSKNEGPAQVASVPLSLTTCFKVVMPSTHQTNSYSSRVLKILYYTLLQIKNLNSSFQAQLNQVVSSGAMLQTQVANRNIRRSSRCPIRLNRNNNLLSLNRSLFSHLRCRLGTLRIC